jgi:hypothetical protein
MARGEDRAIAEQLEIAPVRNCQRPNDIPTSKPRPSTTQ